MDIRLPGEVAFAIGRLNKAGHTAYAVGGCVRDSLLGRTPTDWDLTTSALPEQLQAVFSDCKLVETGIQHGTITVWLQDRPLEITTYRIDGSYSDARHPDKVQFTSCLAQDLARRDFTVNALAFHPDEGVIDCFNGQADLQQRLIRCVGDPDLRFTEDGLRVMRGLRFASQLSFSIEEKTDLALRRHAPLLQQIAAERLQSELLRLLCGPEVLEILLQYPSVLGHLIPELLPMVQLNQQTPYHIYDVYEHTVRAVAAAPYDPLLRLTMLLHDTGKPRCFTVDETGRGHFKGHGEVSVTLAQNRLQQLRLDRRTTNRILTLIRYHDADIAPTRSSIKRWLHQLGTEAFFQLMDVKLADTAAQNPQYDRSGDCRRAIEIARDILEQGKCISLSELAVSGADLLALGVPAGKAVGELLQQLLEAVMDEICDNTRADLLQYCQKLREIS